jgi:SAM-dependent methyltransferase
MLHREIVELLSYHARWTERFAWHDVHNVYGKCATDLARAGFGGMAGKRVLDLGCGPMFAFALQCAADGARVSALDTAYVKPDFLPVAFARTLRHGGAKQAVKSAVRRVLFSRRYYRVLEREAGRPLRRFAPDIRFVTADAEASQYPLPPASFDLAASNAVLEHVGDVPAFAREIARVLAPGGLFYGIIHNFYSLSGGHNPDWAYADEHPSKRVPPWDHLRQNLSPAFVHLNRMRPEAYRSALGEALDVLLFEGRDINHDPPGVEGDRFLTPEIAAELSAYPRELLLTRSWCVIARKP